MKAALLRFGRTPVLVDLSDLKDHEGNTLSESDIYVRSLTAAERYAFAESVKDKGGVDNELAYLCAVTSTGERYFTVEEASGLDHRVAERIAFEAMKVSGFATKAAEDAAKNSESNPS